MHQVGHLPSVKCTSYYYVCLIASYVHELLIKIVLKYVLELYTYLKLTIIIPVQVIFFSHSPCGRSLVGVAGSNHSGGDGCPSVVSVVCFQMVVSGSG